MNRYAAVRDVKKDDLSENECDDFFVLIFSSKRKPNLNSKHAFSFDFGMASFTFRILCNRI